MIIISRPNRIYVQIWANWANNWNEVPSICTYNLFNIRLFNFFHFMRRYFSYSCYSLFFIAVVYHNGDNVTHLPDSPILLYDSPYLNSDLSSDKHNSSCSTLSPVRQNWWGKTITKPPKILIIHLFKNLTHQAEKERYRYSKLDIGQEISDSTRVIRKSVIKIIKYYLHTHTISSTKLSQNRVR